MSDEQCPATNNRGEPCGLAAGWGVEDAETGGDDAGPCKFHGGATPTADENPKQGRGDQDGNGNAETHGLRSDPGPYYDRRSEDEQERIDGWADSWARRADYDGLGFDKLFHTHAIKLHQVESGDDYIAAEGSIVSRVVGRTESGAPIEQDDENPAFQYQNRALTSIMQFLKKMGCLDDPDSQQAGAIQDAATAWREAAQQE